MKRLILFELMLLFLATTFESDSPPGWFQQTLPVNKIINDIFFIDSSNGWAVTAKSVAGDTSYVLKTTNSGTNWNVVYNLTNHFRVVQFLDLNTGYIAGGTVGGTAQLYKTTDGGISWSIMLSVLSGSNFRDVFFVNKDTGWVGDDNISGGAGLRKTTDGGLSWTQQLSGSFAPSKLFFINKDTGWAACQNVNLYRTTNGGSLWTLQFASVFNIESIFFLTPQKGWMKGAPDLNGNGASYTTDGGSNWISCQGNTSTAVGYDIKFINDSIGFSGGSFLEIPKSTDGGKTWGYQNSPIFTQLSTSFFKDDSLKGWQAYNGIVHTTDGGGSLILGINQVSSEIPSDYMLYQNYPNPFNPVTNIKYSVKRETSKLQGQSSVKLMIFDIQGKLITELVNQKQNAGTYEVDWNASCFASGIYFYSLIVEGVIHQTRRMALVK
ncbi:MAG: T9SS type A sorting domain-containing protein [Ignavibacteria bacterium]|nr:T9SS type A sorting domain-containing protein [Ignavibacteria bacterium]